VEFRDRVDAHRVVILLAPMEGEMPFIALTARLDVRYDARNGGPVSPGKATMKASNARTAAGLRWEPPDASSATSTFTAATIQASSANRGEFFNDLLNRPP
jgi:hypothetical protein